MFLQGKARRAQPTKVAHAPFHVVDAAALPALEVVVMPLTSRLVAPGLPRQGYWADAAIFGELLQRAVHGRDAERGRLIAGQRVRFLWQKGPPGPDDGAQDSSPLQRVSFHGPDCRRLEQGNPFLV